VESKNKDLGTYSCKLDRHTIALSLSLKDLEGKSVGRNFVEVTARILDEFRFRKEIYRTDHPLSDKQTATYQA